MALMMVYKGTKFIDDMTVVFIVLVAINLGVFLIQIIVGLLINFVEWVNIKISIYQQENLDK